MPPESPQHRRTHNLLLVSRLLNLRDNVSPFTLLLDSLSQSAKPLVLEYLLRATISKTNVVFVSFETMHRPSPVGVFIKGRGKHIAEIQKEVVGAITAGGGGSGEGRTLLIVDCLNYLSTCHPSKLCPFLSSLLMPNTSLLSTYHTDVPLPNEPVTSPHPLTLLKYLATTVVTLHSIRHVLQMKVNRDVALRPPVWGLEEGVEGVVVGLGSNPGEGVVLEMEYRRKSGRAVVEWFYLPTRGDGGVVHGGKEREKERVILLEDHPQWKASEQVRHQGEEEEDGVDDGILRTTFELGITERQKKARDEVLLPYMDAQREGGGAGGAILFTPEKEVDDFDEEEDEL